jgi:hypothetical protein
MEWAADAIAAREVGDQQVAVSQRRAVEWEVASREVGHSASFAPKSRPAEPDRRDPATAR